MNVVNTRPYKPFECELGPDHVLVHFGVVVCQSKNNLNSVIVPTTEFGILKRDGEDGVADNNKVTVDGNGIIYLELTLSETFYEEKLEQWRSCFHNKDSESMSTYLDENFSQEAVGEFFQSLGAYMMLKPYFSPLVNITPEIISAQIKFLQISLSEAEDSDFFNFISTDLKKRIPIATINSNRSPQLTQIIENDYFFTFPCLWKENQSEFFLEPNE